MTAVGRAADAGPRATLREAHWAEPRGNWAEPRGNWAERVKRASQRTWPDA